MRPFFARRIRCITVPKQKQKQKEMELKNAAKIYERFSCARSG